MNATDDLALTHTFARVAQRLVGHDDLDGLLGAVSALAVEVVDGCDDAAISLLEHRQVTTRGATGELPRLVDLLQYDTGEGPCLSVLREEPVIVVDDIRSEQRWEAFRQAATDLELRSMLAYRLEAGERLLGSLNLYARSPGAFRSNNGAAPVEVGAIFAAHASASILATQRSANLAEALETRSTISMAVGILMARQGIGESEAFDILKRASQRTNVKLRDVARRLAEGADDPPR